MNLSTILLQSPAMSSTPTPVNAPRLEGFSSKEADRLAVPKTSYDPRISPSAILPGPAPSIALSTTRFDSTNGDSSSHSSPPSLPISRICSTGRLSLCLCIPIKLTILTATHEHSDGHGSSRKCQYGECSTEEVEVLCKTQHELELHYNESCRALHAIRVQLAGLRDQVEGLEGLSSDYGKCLERLHSVLRYDGRGYGESRDGMEGGEDGEGGCESE